MAQEIANRCVIEDDTCTHYCSVWPITATIAWPAAQMGHLEHTNRRPGCSATSPRSA